MESVTPETDDSVHGIIFRGMGVRKQEFCELDRNSLYFGAGRKTYRFPCAPNARHLKWWNGRYLWHLDAMQALYRSHVPR